MSCNLFKYLCFGAYLCFAFGEITNALIGLLFLHFQLFLHFRPINALMTSISSSSSLYHISIALAVPWNRYVPVHLEYILTEILKNSYRATAERRRSSSASASTNNPPAPVLVTISPSADYLSLRIRDQGGGIPPSNLSQVFSYAFTTARPTSSFGRDDHELAGGPYAAQHIGGAAAMVGNSDGSCARAGKGESVNSGMFGEIIAAGVQSGMGTIAGFGYGYSSFSP